MPDSPPRTAPDADSGTSHFVTALDVALPLPLASLGTRGLAQALDLGVILVLITAWTIAIASVGVMGRFQGGVALALWLVGMFCLQWGYFLLFEGFMAGQTPGKRALGLRVVQDDGAAVAWGPCLVRNLLRVVDFLPMFYGVGVIAMTLSSQGRRLGDLAAGTVVVREDRPGPNLRVSLVFPPGFSGEDVILVETWFHRVDGLLPQRRQALARDLLSWLERTHPECLARVPQDLDAVERIRRAFVEGP